jgi:hypothetical protein
MAKVEEKPEYLRLTLWSSQVLMTIIAVTFEEGKIYLPSLVVGAMLNYFVFLSVIELSIWVVWRRKASTSKYRDFWTLSFSIMVFLLFVVAHKAIDVIPQRFHKPDPVNLTELLIALIAAAVYYSVLSGRVRKRN